MFKKIIAVLFIIPAFGLLGCEEDGNSDSPSETGMTPPSLSVSCTTATDASCDTASDGADVMLAWTSETCAAFEGNLNVVNAQLASCDSGGCDASNSGDWLDDETDEVITTIPSTATTSIAWLNFFDNGVSDSAGPQSGDVYCCLDGDGSDVVMNDSHCVVVP